MNYIGLLLRPFRKSVKETSNFQSYTIICWKILQWKEFSYYADSQGQLGSIILIEN